MVVSSACLSGVVKSSSCLNCSACLCIEYNFFLPSCSCTSSIGASSVFFRYVSLGLIIIIIIIIISIITVFAGVLFVHKPGANHAPRASVTQVNHSVHTLRTFLRIRADPSMQIF